MNLLEQHIVLLHEWQELYLLTFNGDGDGDGDGYGYGSGNGNGNGYGYGYGFGLGGDHGGDHG